MDIIIRWGYPLVYLGLALFCKSRFQSTGGKLLALGFGLEFVISVAWRIPELSSAFGSTEFYAIMRYVGFIFFIAFAGLFIKGMNQMSTSPDFTGGTSFGNSSTSTTKGSIIRYLAASAFLNGSSFRRQILDFVEKKYKAFAPELGINFPVLLRICKYLENRETKFQFIFWGISVVFLLTVSAIAGESYRPEEQIIPLAILFILVAWVIRVYKHRKEQNWARTFFKQSDFHQKKLPKIFNVEIDSEIEKFFSQDGQNLIVYDGFVPFVGAGIELGGWSFAVDLSRPKEDITKNKEIKPFELNDIYSMIDNSLQELEFPGLKIQEALFVNGSDIRDKKWILPTTYSRPVKHVSDDDFNKLINSNDPSIRHYKWIQVHDWGNELIVSYFLRFSRRGDNLFVEVNLFLLTPLANQYRKVDALITEDWKMKLASAIGLLLVTPFSVLYSWLALFGKFSMALSRIFNTRDREARKQIKYNPLYNYGAQRSLREIFSSQYYNHYFQKLDKEMYLKIIERELLDTIVDFLDSHNIDTSDIKERQTTIMNNGIIVKSGDVRAETLAVGKGAQATTQKPGKKLLTRKK